MNKIIETNRVADIYLKNIIPLIRNQKRHRYFDWNDAIEYMIERLEAMKDFTCVMCIDDMGANKIKEALVLQKECEDNREHCKGCHIRYCWMDD